MGKITLQEQITRTLKIMGVISEAAQLPRGGFIDLILKKFVKNELDVFYVAIEKETGETLSQRGVNSILGLINNNKISRKKVLTIMVDIFKQGKKDVGLFANFIKSDASNYFADLQKLIKGDVSRQDIKAVLPELEELPEEIFEDLLIKAGFREATEESIDTSVRSMNKIFPFLFKEKGWFFNKKFANEENINSAIESLSRDFAGKNSDGLEDVIEQKLKKIEINLKANNLGAEDVKKLDKLLAFLKKNMNPLVYKKVNGQTVISARKSMVSLLGKGALAGAAVGGAIAVFVFIELIILFMKNNTGSKFGDMLLAFDQEFGGSAEVVTRNTYKPGSLTDLAKYLTDNYGKEDWLNEEIYTIIANENGVLEITDKEKAIKYFMYDKTNRTYFESDVNGKKL